MPSNLPSTISATSVNQLNGSQKSQTLAINKDYSPGYFPLSSSTSNITTDPEGHLITRGQILTDEGSYRLNCSGNTFGLSIGTCSFVSGSNIVTGTGFYNSLLRMDDYISVGSSSTDIWYQVSDFTDTTITLDYPFAQTSTTTPTYSSLIQPIQGSGATVVMASGSITINVGTTNSSVSEVERVVDIIPLIKECEVSVSQRISNQDIYIGLYDEEGSPSNIRWFAWFHLTGDSATTVICESASNRDSIPDQFDIQATTVSQNIFTDIYNQYRIECLNEEVRFIINGVVVAIHKRAIFKPYDVLTSSIRVVNGTGVSSNTVISINYDSCYNYNRVNIAFADYDSKLLRSNTIGENDSAIPITPRSQKIWRTSFAKTISGSIDTDVFSIITTGSLTTVSQSVGNLVIGSGIGARQEVILRSKNYWNDALLFRYQTQLSQRIVNTNYFIELTDIIGDNLPCSLGTIHGASASFTISIPNNPFTSANVSQSIYIGNFKGTSSLTGSVGGRYMIASASSDSITLFCSSSGVPSSSAQGSCSLWGWNYYHMLYGGTTATNVFFDSQRKGWNAGETTATINTTAAPGHMGLLYVEDVTATYSDQLVASSTTFQPIARASRVINIPGIDTNLYIQIRTQNGIVAPASNTAFTIGLISVEDFAPLPVSLQSARPCGPNSAVNANVTGSIQVFNATAANLNATVTATNLSSNIAQVAGQTAATVAPGGSATTPNALGTYLISPTTNNVIEVPVLARTGSSIVLVSPTTVGGYLSAVLNVSKSISGSGTIDCRLQESFDNGTGSWVDVYHFNRLTSGSQTDWMPPIPLGGRRRWAFDVLGGFTCSLSVTTTTSNVAQPLFRQYFDRSLGVVSGALGSSSAAYNVAGCKVINAYAVVSGSTTTASFYQLQLSNDSSSWANVGTPTQASTASMVQFGVSNISARFARVIVTESGIQTGSYICITGTN